MQPIFDSEWRRLALGGDAEAVRAFADAVLTPLYHFCLHRVGRNRHRCEEVVQETLVRALRELERYDPPRGGNNIFPWLTGLARNEISRVLAREKHTVSLNELWRQMDAELLGLYERLESQPLADDVLEREETRELVNVTMSQLPPQYREALEAKYVRGASVHDLAALWRTTEKAVESLLSRARKAFRAARLRGTAMTEPNQLPGDDNVERLVGHAYRPDPIAPEFVQRVHARLGEVAAERRPQRLSRRRLLAVTGGMAAMVALIVLPQALWRLAVPETPAPSKKSPSQVADQRGPERLTVQPRGRAPALETLGVGAEVHTQAGQRRCVRLPDGTLLSLNENTAARLDADRRLTLSKGEVFVEVAARSERFIVRTPQREVIALGTKFAVRADRAGTGVLVTQGKVEVGGLGRILVAGQQLAAGSAEVSPAERASHALAWTRDLLARTEPALVPASEHRGGALVAVGPDGRPNRLSLRRYHVDVHIEDGFARTTIDQTYFNAHTARLEGTFFFPLPADASLSRLAMYVDGTRMEGGMVERDYGRAVYQGIVNKMKDPALLEWVDGTTFKMRVFPLEPRQEKRIILSYTQKLPALYGRATYRFPAGHSLEEVRDWSFLARIKDGAKLNWHSPTHTLIPSTDKNDLLLTATAHVTRVDRDIALDVEEPTQRGLGEVVRFSSAEHEGARYLMVRYRPALPVTAQQAKVKRRDWVFLFESSAERDPLLARTQIEIIRHLLENCGHDDTFAILTAGTRCRLLTPRPLTATPANVRKVLASLEATHLIGALDLEKALATAAPLLKAAGNPHLVYLGSGLPRLGERRPERLLGKLPAGTRFVGVGVGKRWNRAFMKTAAEHSGGYFTQINPDEVVGWRAFELLATLNTPQLLNLRVEAAGKKLSFLTDAATLAQGEELCAVTRAEGKDIAWPAAVSVSGTLDGKPFRREFVVAGVATKADYLPRTWGRLEIDRLLAAGAEQNKEKIIALSKALYVMSPFTSLLVLENEAMYKQYKVDRGRKDHWAPYSCPDRIPVVTEPLHGRPFAQRMVRLPASALPWKDVFQWLARETGKPVINSASKKLTGTLPLHIPEGTTCTLRQVIGLINESLKDQKARLIQKQRSFVLVPTDEKVDPTLVPQIDVKDLDDHDDTEIVRVMVQLHNVNAGEIEGQVKRMLGKFSEVAAIPAANQLVLTDTVASIKRVLDTLKPIGRHDPESVLKTVVRRGWGRFARRDVHGEGLEPLGMGVIVDPKEAHWPGSVAFSPDGQRLLVGSADGAVRLWDTATGQQGRGDPTVRMQAFSGIDPALVQQAIAAIQGRPEAQRRAPVWDSSPAATGSGDVDKNRLRRLAENWGRLPSREREAHLRDLLRDLPPRYAEVVREYFRPLSEEVGAPELPDVSGGGLLGRESIRGYGGFGIPFGSTRQRIENDLGYYPASLALVVRGTSMLYSRPRQALQEKVVEGPDLRASRALFRDLVSFAPGMDTTLADALAVLEIEANLPQRSRPGNISAPARALIDRGRAAGWEAVTVPLGDGEDRLTILCDGQGRYRCEHLLDTALRELIVCDGKSLLHLYPELGLGARRNVSRFHRRELSALVPWLLPPADEMAQGADLELVDKQTVAIVPHQGSVCVHLIFAADGRLTERRLLLTKTRRLLERQSYAVDGTVRRLDADGKLLSEQRLTRRAAGAPDLKPNLAELVVLPLPWRTPKLPEPKHPDKLVKLATLFAERKPDLGAFITEQFLNKGDRRIGLFTLLAATRDLNKKLSRGLDSKSRLGDYLLQFRGGDAKEGPERRITELPLDFLSRMKALYRLHKLPGDRLLMSRDHEERLLQYVRLCRSPRLLWSLVQAWKVQPMPREGRGPAKLRPRVLEAAAQGLHDLPNFGYAARYEYARCLLEGGGKREARKGFEEAYAEALASGLLPRIDAAFRRALEDAGKGTGPWWPLMRRTAERLLKQRDLAAALAVVEQCWSVGDVELGDELVMKVVSADAPAEVRAQVILRVVDVLCRAQRDFKADELLRGVLARSDALRDPELYRTASRLAGHIDGLRRALPYLEKALELEWQDRPALLDVQAIRRDYEQLLAYYGRLAQASADLGQRPPAGLTERVVRAADRWRSLDRDGPAAEKAADVLLTLREREAAWDYLTTWLGREDSAKAWQGAAENLRLRREYVLADRALAAAAAASPQSP